MNNNATTIPQAQSVFCSPGLRCSQYSLSSSMTASIELEAPTAPRMAIRLRRVCEEAHTWRAFFGPLRGQLSTTGQGFVERAAWPAVRLHPEFQLHLLDC